MNPRLEPGSFRDRTGRIFYQEGRVLRALAAEAYEAWRGLRATDFFAAALKDGKIVDTREAELGARELDALAQAAGAPRWVAALEHERLPFISYPYEWSFGMLRDAALLQLELLEAALAEGFTMKDASSFNVQWRGTSPVFIDVASFEAWRQGDPWVGYLQFCELFLNPLLLTAYRDVPFHPWLRGSLEGIRPADLARLLRLGDLLRPGVLADVLLQARLQKPRQPPQKGSGKDGLRQDLRRAGFKKEMITANVRRLQKIVGRLTWRRSTSEWARYAEENSYDDEGRERKAAFVEEAVASRSWGLVWDLGANTGVFSRIAATQAEQVVAMDADPLTVELMYRRLRAEGPKNILPLVVDLADASPALGWRLQERRALTERSRPELTLCLALIHHLVLSANLPLGELVAWLARLGSHLVIEFVGKEDPMARHLLKNKEDLYFDYELPAFEAALGQHCEILRETSLPGGHRKLYFARGVS